MPPIKKMSTPKPQLKKVNVAPLKVEMERPVLRMFECLVHAEQAKAHLDQIGVYSGPDSEEMGNLARELRAKVEELRVLYRAYWKQVQIQTEKNNA